MLTWIIRYHHHLQRRSPHVCLKTAALAFEARYAGMWRRRYASQPV